MTNDELRELDAEVHLKVFGKGSTFDAGGLWEWLDGEENYGDESEQVPQYSTDIAAAWLVVAKMISIEEDQDFHLEHREHEGWAVGCCHREEWITGETAPIAICRAALKAAESMKG